MRTIGAGSLRSEHERVDVELDCGPAPRLAVTDGLPAVGAGLLKDRAVTRRKHLGAGAERWCALRLPVGAHHVFESHHEAALDERRVTRAYRAQQGDSLIDTRHVRLAVEPGLVSHHLDPEILRDAGDLAMRGLGLITQFGHQPEER